MVFIPVDYRDSCGAKHYKDQQTSGTRARNFFHNIKIGNDVDRIMISTTEQCFDARDITVGDRVRDWSGQMADQTVQYLAQARSSVVLAGEGKSVQEETLDKQYGEGRRLGF